MLDDNDDDTFKRQKTESRTNFAAVVPDFIWQWVKANMWFRLLVAWKWTHDLSRKVHPQ